MGLVSGYISIGLIGFFTCLSVELGHQNSVSNLYIADTLVNGVTDRLMYFSYITLMTIGYGDIYPLTAIAQKATMFISLAGQFYLVIITAIVVGKYVNQKSMQTPDKKG
ncbi:MAG: ion channel [Rhodothermaceae bacterium]